MNLILLKAHVAAVVVIFTLTVLSTVTAAADDELLFDRTDDAESSRAGPREQRNTDLHEGQ